MLCFLSLCKTLNCASCGNSGSVLHLGADLSIMPIVLFIPKIAFFAYMHIQWVYEL